jgi:hypothetical protein
VKNSLFSAQKYFFDHSKVRFTANERLFGATSFQNRALRAQTLSLQPFRFPKNG